jgi:hypothetical protein
MALDPSVRLTTAYQIPANTFRASTVSDMVSIAADSVPTSIVYDVGIAPVYQKTFALRNDTINCTLQIDLDVPYWMALTNSQKNFTLAPQQTVKLIVILNEVSAVNTIRNNIRHDIQSLKVSATPLDITGPVLVKTPKPALIV